MADVLHQFEVHPMGAPLHMGAFELSFTNSTMWMAIAAAFSALLLTVAMRRKAMVPGRFQATAEIAYEFVANMIRENVGKDGMHYFPLIFTLFIMVFLGNAMGLLPYAFTYTSQLAVTFTFAVIVFLCVCILGIARQGLHFFSLFLPPGVPWVMIPLIVPIEILSFLIRPITLSVRLFANMLAGHILLAVIGGFSVTFFLALGVAGAGLGILPALFNTVLLAFELLIAFLQAYVFAVLSCIYLKDTVELSH